MHVASTEPLSPPLPQTQPQRLVFQADALNWLQENVATDTMSVITSLPDLSELSGATLDVWKRWFIDATRSVLRWLPISGVAIFYQSDIRHCGEWIDKGYLMLKAAEAEGAYLLWHKIVCRQPPLTIAHGRPSYSHMICIGRVTREKVRCPGPDVLPNAGHMLWSRAIGLNACEVACRFIRDETRCRTIVDPFCGRGTVLAMANHFGFDAIGVDIGGKRCRLARNLRIESTWLSLT